MKSITSIIPFGLIGIFYLSILVSCEEAALPINDDGTPLNVDTVSFPVINTMTYQTPPSMGGTEYLYFGEKDGYKYLYNLLEFEISTSPVENPAGAHYHRGSTVE